MDNEWTKQNHGPINMEGWGALNRGRRGGCGERAGSVVSAQLGYNAIIVRNKRAFLGV